MSAYEPEKLWSLWKREQITIEMVTGHVLQNLVLHHQEVRKLTLTLDKLSKQVNTLTEQVKTLSSAVPKRDASDRHP
jgi:predicted RNA-binding protein (virulence factor B family)